MLKIITIYVRKMNFSILLTLPYKLKFITLCFVCTSIGNILYQVLKHTKSESFETFSWCNSCNNITTIEQK